MGSVEVMNKYTKCKHCDHFIEENSSGHDIVAKSDTTITEKYSDQSTNVLARYVHLDDGEQEYDHDAEPGETRDDWETHRPDLFKQHPDGAIGPNSSYHSQRGKRNEYKDGEVLCLDSGNQIVQWNGEEGKPYTPAETPEEFGIDNLTDVERSRIGL